MILDKEKYFKFTDDFFDNEAECLLLVFTDLNQKDVYEVLATEYLSEDDNTFGITKIRNTNTSAVYDIAELGLLTNDHPFRNSGLVPWCILYSDSSNEYQVVEGFAND